MAISKAVAKRREVRRRDSDDVRAALNGQPTPERPPPAADDIVRFNDAAFLQNWFHTKHELEVAYALLRSNGCSGCGIVSTGDGSIPYRPVLQMDMSVGFPWINGVLCHDCDTAHRESLLDEIRNDPERYRLLASVGQWLVEMPNEVLEEYKNQKVGDFLPKASEETDE